MALLQNKQVVELKVKERRESKIITISGEKTPPKSTLMRKFGSAMQKRLNYAAQVTGSSLHLPPMKEPLDADRKEITLPQVEEEDTEPETKQNCCCRKDRTKFANFSKVAKKKRIR